MKIIEPQVELWQQGEDPVAHVAKCARVCYGNAVSKGEKADQALYDSLIKQKHLSMFRHESVYAIIRGYEEYEVQELLDYRASPYLSFKFFDGAAYIATNRNFMIDAGDEFIERLISKHQVTPECFANTATGHSMMRYTFHIITQISTSRELNRASPNNIAEKSTRYCLEGGVLCRPHWISRDEVGCWNTMDEDCGNLTLLKPTNQNVYLGNCMIAFYTYKTLVEEGMKREDARGILPLDTATEVIYTYSANEWRHIIELRSDKRAHPNCQIFANMVKSQLEQLGYEF